jgi:hypothetical protein
LEKNATLLDIWGRLGGGGSHRLTAFACIPKCRSIDIDESPVV